MPIQGLNTRRRGVGLPILPLFSGGVLLAALILFVIQLGKFAQGHNLIQTDITVANIPMPTGLTYTDLVPIWQTIYDQPVELDYQSNRIWLRPSDVGFHTNDDLMITTIQSKLQGTSNYWLDFWNYLWRRPTSPIAVDLVADYNEALLRSFLQDVANRYEQQASSADFNANTFSFGSGSTGTHIDIDQSIHLIDAALKRPTNRKVQLPLQGETAHAPDMTTLKNAILSYLAAQGILLDAQDSPAIVGSIVIIDLQSRREVLINPDVAYSSMSTLSLIHI